MKFTEHTLIAPLPEDLQKLKWYGDFPVMERVINKKLKNDIPQALRDRLQAELEIIRRLPAQYPYSWEEALEIMQKNFIDFSREEFQELWEDDAMDWIYLQGKVQFKSNFLSNLIKTREWLCKRLIFPELAADKQANSEFLMKTIAEMKANGKISRRFQVTTTLRLSEQAERPGEPIRVYLPVPVEYAQVKHFRLLRAQILTADGQTRDVPVLRLAADGGVPVLHPAADGQACDGVPILHPAADGQACGGVSVLRPAADGQACGSTGKPTAQENSGFQAWIAPEHAAQRTLCFQGEYQKEVFFRIVYEYQTDMPYIDLYNGQNSPVQGWIPQEQEDMPGYYLGEQLPHIHFTPYLQALTNEIVGQETQPLKKARKIYDYITTHLMYSFVRDYFSITELVDYPASGWKGDCGLQALLFITLCRIAGIPARWQSGLYAKPGDAGSHDWAMFYLEEYGWLFADCSFGGSAARMGCEERREFYFGNLDPYRMPSCCQFQADFQPPVSHLRNDPYDNQTGEVEYADGCLLADEIETMHEVIILD